MSISPGTRLGPYEILTLIGSGGMGEVYRARDTKLNRDIAIKVLPDLVANDPERLARFEREARLLAALNHPNIAHIHGLEESNGIRALVMELVEGPTLADRIARGPIRLDEGLPIAKQITAALEAAHEQGIIHRDLKPANVKVREDGTVKVLDFGLAKLAAPDASRIDPLALSQSPTVTAPAATMTGVILGTAAYMAPEQARGKVVDNRADIWAFGCVLYETLTGQRAFVGEDVTDFVVNVMTEEPDWAALWASTPRRMLELLKRCLKKDPRERLRDIGDARIEITEALRVPERQQSATSSATSSSSRNAFSWAVVAIVSLVTIVAVLNRTRESVAMPGVARVTVALAEGKRLWLNDGSGGRPAIALAPDGSRIVFAVDESGTSKLYVREIDSFESKPIVGTEGAFNPFFSPDGQWIGFFTTRELRKVSLSGTGLQTLCEVSPVTRGGTWSPDGTVLIVDDGGSSRCKPRRWELDAPRRRGMAN